MIKTFLCASLALSISAGTALALSCLRPDPAQSFTKAAESDDSYVVLFGSFTLPEDAKQPDGKTIKEAKIASRFAGKLMTGEGFNEDVTADVTIDLTCAASWCGQIKADTPYLAYVLQTENALTLRVNACHSDLFANPTDDTLQTTLACAKGGPCKPAD